MGCTVFESPSVQGSRLKGHAPRLMMLLWLSCGCPVFQLSRQLLGMSRPCWWIRPIRKQLSRGLSREHLMGLRFQKKTRLKPKTPQILGDLRTAWGAGSEWGPSDVDRGAPAAASHSPPSKTDPSFLRSPPLLNRYHCFAAGYACPHTCPLTPSRDSDRTWQNPLSSFSRLIAQPPTVAD